MRRILITGSRTWDAPWIVHQELAGILTQGPFTLVYGECKQGVDRQAETWAKAMIASGRLVTLEPHPARWDTFGAAAGPIRNKAMVDLGAYLCLAFISPCVRVDCMKPKPHGSHGAVGCVTLADEAGIPVRIFKR
jgi:hypothetical protein